MPVKITSPRAVNRRGDGELPDWQQNPIVHGCIRQCGRQQPRPDASHQRHHHDRRVKGEIGRQSGTDPLGKQHSEPQPRCHCRMRPTWACSRASTLFASPDPKRIGLPLACRTAGSRKCSTGVYSAPGLPPLCSCFSISSRACWSVLRTMPPNRQASPNFTSPKYLRTTGAPS